MGLLVDGLIRERVCLFVCLIIIGLVRKVAELISCVSSRCCLCLIDGASFLCRPHHCHGDFHYTIASVSRTLLFKG